MTTIFNPYEITVLTYDQPTENELVLTGNYVGDNISARMKKVPWCPSCLPYAVVTGSASVPTSVIDTNELTCKSH